MEDSGRGPDLVAEAERLIQSLKNVVGVNVTRGRDGSIVEIHVLADGHRPPKAIVRDVKSALKAELQIDVDYRKISVAMRKDGEGDEAVVVPIEEIEAPEPPEAPRTRLSSLSLHVEDLRSTARVELSLGEREVLGAATGPTGRDAAPRLIAAATLEAVTSLIAEDSAFSLGGIEILEVGGDEIAVVSVRCVADRHERTLVGGCRVARDLHQSVVYATLDAVNRILGRMKLKEPVEFELRSTSI